jgi:hypothetical protein
MIPDLGECCCDSGACVLAEALLKFSPSLEEDAAPSKAKEHNLYLPHACKKL